MELIKGNVITINNNKYIIIETLNYNYEKYLFVNELKGDEDISDNYYIFKAKDDAAIKITDEKIINMLLDKFKILINEDINYFLEKNN